MLRIGLCILLRWFDFCYFVLFFMSLFLGLVDLCVCVVCVVLLLWVCLRGRFP